MKPVIQAGCVASKLNLLMIHHVDSLAGATLREQQIATAIVGGVLKEVLEVKILQMPRTES